MILITGAATRIGAAIARRLSTVFCHPRGGVADPGDPCFQFSNVSKLESQECEKVDPRAPPSAAPRMTGNGVIIHYNSSQKAAEQLADELRAAGADITLWQQDFRADDLAAQFGKLISKTGAIDTLINNAAVFYPEQDKLGSITPDFWQHVMQVNACAPLCLMQEFAAQLPADAQGNIVNMLDQRVLNISHAFPVYTASKSALWAMTKNMARALAPNIRVNAIAPGHVLPSAGEDENKFQARQEKTPLGVGPTPKQIAETIQMILASPSMTGACIPLDGGEHLVPKEK